MYYNFRRNILIARLHWCTTFIAGNRDTGQETISSTNDFILSVHELSLGLCRLPPSRMLASSFSSSSFCSLLRFTGVSTTTLQNRSPACTPRTLRTPLPRKRKTLSVCVPAGIFRLALPSRVGIHKIIENLRRISIFYAGTFKRELQAIKKAAEATFLTINLKYLLHTDRKSTRLNSSHAR